MSQIRDPAYITEQGRTMMTAGGDVTYTKAVLYGQDISHLTADQVQALTSIGSPLKQVPIGVSDKQSNGKDTTVVLEATFQNDGLTADLPYTAVGFFAKKGEDEKLIIVAVANAGAYLAATRPDGVATDALDLKVAIAIGDATNVTAVVDPAASVTPATLNGAINETKQVLTALIDTKASQSNLDQTNAEVAKKADSEAVNSQLATKANTTDIDKQVKTLNDAINTKADKATVDAEIAKIDFTPYAKTADVTAQINAVSDEIATKVGADYSYSKAQLDEKLLALSTDTNGKVSADQVTALIADKANKADVDNQIKDINDAVATKADKATVDAEISKIDFTPYAKTADVNAGLAQKDDTTDVDAKIKTVTDLANTKASQDSLNKLSQAVDTKADKATVDAQIAEIDFSKIKFRKQYLDGQGQTQDHTWKATKNTDGTYTIDLYNDDWTASKVHALLAQLPTKADQSNVNSLVQDAKNTATSRADNLQNQVNNLKGARTVNSPDFDSLTDTGPYYVTNPEKGENSPCGGTWGTLVVANGNGHRIEQVYFPDNNDMPFYRMKDEGTWRSWVQLSSKNDISNLQNQINTKLDASTFNSRVNTASTTYRMLDNTSDWNTIFGVPNGNNVLSSLRVNGTAPGPLLNNYSAGVGFGGEDTKGVLTVAYGDHQARISGGNGSAPVWSEDVAWKSDVNNLQNQVNDLINQINYIKQNYLQGKRFPANQEAQAEQWENANPNGIAMIEK